MITREDLQAAVAAGTVSEAQAAALANLAADRQSGRDSLAPKDEPFELFKGFNEIFIVVGLGILGFGWFGIAQLAIFRAADRAQAIVVAGVITAILIAAISEYFIRRRRMVAPANALCIVWAVNAAGTWLTLFGSYSLLGGVNLEDSAVPAALVCVTIAVFWVRYRVPFAMGLLAAAGFVTIILALSTTAGNPEWRDLFLLSSQGPFAFATLFFGLILFAAAMWFDMGDPHRISLRSANGFWLHVAAAPAIVNTIALTLLNIGGAALTVLAIILSGLAIIAVIIDRRSFLISAVGYVVVLISLISDGQGTAPMILILGAGLVGLGAGWQGVRARLIRPVPEAVRRRLPPSSVS